MTDIPSQPFARLVQLGDCLTTTDWWLLFSAATPSGPVQVAVEHQAYDALITSAAAEATADDARDNALMEIEVVLEHKYRQDPSKALFVIGAEIEEAVQRYLPE